MDIISFNEAATANGRIEIINANPDSTSGIVTVPKTIASGETVTVPAGRVAVLPNVQVDGTLNVQGEVFIPSGATFGDLESQIDTKQSKSELAYDVNTNSYIANTLASGAIIERGSNANGKYTKFADGTLICTGLIPCSGNIDIQLGSLYTTPSTVWTFPASFVNYGSYSISGSEKYGVGNCFFTRADGDSETGTSCSFKGVRGAAVNDVPVFMLTAIGRWK